MVGVLMYLTASRLDIIRVTCYCARYQARPTEKHLKEVKLVFWYLKNTIYMGLWYLKDTRFELTAFSDLNHAGCLDKRKSTSGGIKFLGGDKLVNWSSKKQDCTFMSSAKAELEAYDGEINLGVEENMISNEYAVKLCLEHEVKRENKIVKKEFIVTLRSEIDFVKFIINPEEYDVEPGVIFRRSFLRKTNRNKKRVMENLNLFYQDIGTSSSTGRHLTQEEAAKEALALRISQKFALLEEVRPVLETMAYHDKYKKVLDEIWKDKVELDGMIVKQKEEAIKKVKGEALKEKDDPRAFIFPIRLEGQVNKNALVDTGLDINTMPYRIYEQLRREEMKKVDKGITMINHTQVEAIGILTNVLFQDVLNGMGCDGEIDDMLRIKLCEAKSNEEIFTYVAWIRDFNTKEPIYVELCHEFYSTYDIDKVCADGELQNKKIIKFRLGGRAHNLTLLEFAQRLGLYHADELKEDEFDVYFQGGLPSDDHFNAQEYWLSISREENLSLLRSHASTIRNSILRVIPKMITYGLCQRNTRDLDMTTLRELIDSEGRLIPEDPMGGMEIRHEAIERMEYKQSYHWDRYQGVFEHMAGVYSVLLQGAYNPPGYAQPQYDHYYQQYPPLPLQYQHQQQRDDDK
nr:uncharacterized mitochondrial protein AtMg00810-like [Tanacetum cinerariifolium]